MKKIILACLLLTGLSSCTLEELNCGEITNVKETINPSVFYVTVNYNGDIKEFTTSRKNLHIGDQFCN